MSNYTIDNLIPATAGAGRNPAIKVGSQVFLVQSGVDVSDTTAAAEDVLAGKKFHDSTGALVSGGMQSIGAQIIVPDFTEHVISSGVHLGGSIIVRPVSNSHNIYLCTSASDPVFYRLTNDTFGGDYTRDPEDLDGKAVYTNGTYYLMPTSNWAFPPYSSSWVLRTSKSWDSAYNINDYNFALHPDYFRTSGGEIVGIVPERVESGTWNGREMTVNSAGYYEAGSDVTSGLTYTGIIPQAGQMYTGDALKHIDQVWNYDYKRDIKTLYTSYQNEMRPGQEVYAEGISGPDSGGWFTFGDGASVTYSGYDEWGGGGTQFEAKSNDFTLAFKFKPVSLGSHPYYNKIIGIEGFGWICIDSSDNALWIDYDNGAYSGGVDGGTLPFTFQLNTEYEIVIHADSRSMRIIINGILVARYNSKNRDQAVSSVTLHEGWDSSWDGCEYQYKELSLWGRSIDELTAFSSSVLVDDNQVLSKGFLIAQGSDTHISGLTLLSNGRAAVWGGAAVEDVHVSAVNSNPFLTILSGGTASSVDVSSGGRMIVQNGAEVSGLNLLSGGMMSATVSAQVTGIQVVSEAGINGYWIQEPLSSASLPVPKSNVRIAGNNLTVSSGGDLHFAVLPEAYTSVAVAGGSKTVTIESGGTAHLGWVNNSTTITNSGTVIGHSAGGSASSGGDFTHIRSASILHNYGIVSGVRIVVSKWWTDTEVVFPQGSMFVHSGGTGLNNYLEGFTVIEAGGVESGPVICPGEGIDWPQTEMVKVESGGLLIDPVMSGSYAGITISSGGTVSGGSVTSGDMYVQGRAAGVTAAGGTLWIGDSSGHSGSGTNLVVSTGGSVAVLSGSVDRVTVYTSGYLAVSSGGTATNVVDSGGSIYGDGTIIYA